MQPRERLGSQSVDANLVLGTNSTELHHGVARLSSSQTEKTPKVGPKLRGIEIEKTSKQFVLRPAQRTRVAFFEAAKLTDCHAEHLEQFLIAAVANTERNRHRSNPQDAVAFVVASDRPCALIGLERDLGFRTRCARKGGLVDHHPNPSAIHRLA